MQLAGHTYSMCKFPARSLQVRPGSRQEVVAISIKRKREKRSLNIESHFVPVAAQGAWHGLALRHLFPSCHTKSKWRQKVSANSSGRGSIKAFPASSIARRHQANYEKDFSELTLGWPTTTTPCQDGQDRRDRGDRRQTAIIVVAVMAVTTRRAMGKSDDDNEGIWPLGVT